MVLTAVSMGAMCLLIMKNSCSMFQRSSNMRGTEGAGSTHDGAAVRQLEPSG